MKQNLYMGLMSGTSMDAIDAVLVEIDDDGLRLLQMHSECYSPELSARLKLAVSNQANPDEIARLDRLTGEAFADCALKVLRKSGIPAASVAAVGSHGQTLRHAPEGKEGFSLQIGDPNTIAERTNITTIADFRRRDIAAGGQGAPLVPAFHAWLFGIENQPRVILNLGGIANVTLIPPKDSDAGVKAVPAVSGFDTGPANTLLDNWCLRYLGAPYDSGGNWARSGTLCQPLLESLLADPYFQRCPPKSTGLEQFNLAWLDRQLKTFPSLTPVDIQRTLLELTAVSIADALEDLPKADLVICGGGYKNIYLLERLRDLMPGRQLNTTARLGLAPEAVEGAAFAWLARQTLSGLPGNSPASTGSRGPRVLGGIYSAR